MEKIRNYRVKIIGTYKGKFWEYIDPPNRAGTAFAFAPGEYFDNEDWEPSEFWFSQGNFSCDCNRSRLLPADMQKDFDPDNIMCTETIMIDRIEPIEQPIAGFAIPPIVLNETIQGHQ